MSDILTTFRLLDYIFDTINRTFSLLATPGHPIINPFMLNRATSERPYGIWGTLY